jgi:hypothetical protein
MAGMAAAAAAAASQHECLLEPVFLPRWPTLHGCSAAAAPCPCLLLSLAAAALGFAGYVDHSHAQSPLLALYALCIGNFPVAGDLLHRPDYQERLGCCFPPATLHWLLLESRACFHQQLQVVYIHLLSLFLLLFLMLLLLSVHNEGLWWLGLSCHLCQAPVHL